MHKEKKVGVTKNEFETFIIVVVVVHIFEELQKPRFLGCFGLDVSEMKRCSLVR